MFHGDIGTETSRSLGTLTDTDRPLSLSADQYIGHLLQASLSLSVLRFTKDIQEGCHWNTRNTPIPVRILEPVYGKLEPSFQDFCLPGMIVT